MCLSLSGIPISSLDNVMITFSENNGNYKRLLILCITPRNSVTNNYYQLYSVTKLRKLNKKKLPFIESIGSNVVL